MFSSIALVTGLTLDCSGDGDVLLLESVDCADALAPGSPAACFESGRGFLVVHETNDEKT